jgi:hypothetical protein
MHIKVTVRNTTYLFCTGVELFSSVVKTPPHLVKIAITSPGLFCKHANHIEAPWRVMHHAWRNANTDTNSISSAEVQIGSSSNKSFFIYLSAPALQNLTGHLFRRGIRSRLLICVDAA